MPWNCLPPLKSVALGEHPIWHGVGVRLSPLPAGPLGIQSAKQKDTAGWGSLLRFLADSALISVVFKREFQVFWLLWRGGWLRRAGWKESGEGSSALFPLFLNKVCLFEDTCALEPLMRVSGDLRTEQPGFFSLH